MKRTVSSMMSRDVCVVDMDDTIAAVEQRLADRHLSWAPVMDDRGAILGVISAVDLLRLHAEGCDTEAVRAWQKCSYRPIAVGASADLADTARLMLERCIHHVVVTEGGAVIGVLSSLDFVREFAANEGLGASRA